ncbi:TPA: hypothetical protein U9I89_000432 [Acinetobacter baumannii]|nr:hypothetical protein [Acinetobacter baumannii]
MYTACIRHEVAPEMDVPWPTPPSVFVPAKAFGAKQITPDKTAADRFKVFDLVFVLPFAISEVATHAPIQAFQMTL